nr:unnamed protein product [Macaca fascicularis]
MGLRPAPSSAAAAAAEVEQRRRPRLCLPPLELLLLLLLSLELLHAGDCQQPAQCRIQKCTTDFVSLTSHLNSAIDGFDSEFCKALRAYAGCTQRTSKACRGNLVYHSAVLGISDLMSQRNCSKDGPTSSTNPEVTHDPCNYHSHAGAREHRRGDQNPPNYLFCGLFGDPHLRTFKDHFQTCKVEGAWPLIDNNYLSVQVTNVPVVPGSSATATNKSAAAAPSPVLGNIPPGDGMPVGPVPPGFFQPFMSPRYPGGPRPPLRIPNQALGGVPGSQPLLPSGMDPTRQQGHPNMGGPMQRMTPPRGMVPLGPQNYGGAMRPPLNALGGPGMPGMNMGPGGGRPWPNPTNANSIPYSSASPGNYVGPPGGGGPPGTPIMPSPADSTNSGDNMYTLMNAVPPGPNRPNFPMGPGSDGPMGGLGGMESHHMNGSLGSGDMDSISKNSPNNMSLSNQPGTPRDDGEMGGNFLNPFQSESYSPSMTMSV